MKFPRISENVAVLALVGLSILATPPLTAQTVISNEALVSTTFVVNKTTATAMCSKTGCYATKRMFAPVSVICPAPNAQTCTLHISLDAKTTVVSSVTSFYQLLVDGAAPTIGPTGEHGGYIFAQNAVLAQGSPLLRSYPASVVATVRNSSSNNHTIVLKIGCGDTNNFGGCMTEANSSTLRVDVFRP